MALFDGWTTFPVLTGETESTTWTTFGPLKDEVVSTTWVTFTPLITTFVPLDVPTIDVINIGATVATVTAIVDVEATFWQIRYKPAASSTWEYVTVPVAELEHTLTALLSDTDYEVSARATIPCCCEETP